MKKAFLDYRHCDRACRRHVFCGQGTRVKATTSVKNADQPITKTIGQPAPEVTFKDSRWHRRYPCQVQGQSRARQFLGHLVRSLLVETPLARKGARRTAFFVHGYPQNGEAFLHTSAAFR